jgi:hypothetical protein
MTAIAKKVTIIHRALWIGFFPVTISTEETAAAKPVAMKSASLNPIASIFNLSPKGSARPVRFVPAIPGEEILPGEQEILPRVVDIFMVLPQPDRLNGACFLAETAEDAA